MASHAEHVKGAEHQAAWLLLLRWRAAQIVRARPKNRLGFTRKREGVDPNTQSLSSCWDLKSHAKLQKLDPRQVKFVRDLVLLIAKALVSIIFFDAEQMVPASTPSAVSITHLSNTE